MGMSLPGPGGPGAVRRRPPDTRGRRMESGTTTCVFQVAGEIRNVSLAAVVATMEGTDLAARRAWDPSTDELRILAKQGHDDIIHWVGPAPGTAPLHTPATLHASSPQTTCCPLLRILLPNPVPSSQRALPRSFRARARREALRTRGRPMQVTDFPWPLSDREYLYRRAPTLPLSLPTLPPARPRHPCRGPPAAPCHALKPRAPAARSQAARDTQPGRLSVVSAARLPPPPAPAPAPRAPLSEL